MRDYGQEPDQTGRENGQAIDDWEKAQMKVRISFETYGVFREVPNDTDMKQYLIDHAYDLVKELFEDPVGILPDDWEEVDEE